MNANAQQLLDRFDQLPRDDQREVAREILRRTASFDVPPLSDEELVGQAHELFLKLDEAEARDAQGS
jgi:hypothetical protein